MKVFYSWQSNIPDNKSYIQSCLSGAIRETEWQIETAVRDTRGAISIPESIMSKIDASDLFMADVSIIGKVGDKPVSNPNVMYELGYAVKHLGWERIILIANRSTTSETRDLPFDIMTRNTLIRDFTEEAKNSLKSELRSILSKFIEPEAQDEVLTNPYIHLTLASTTLNTISFSATNDEPQSYHLDLITLGAHDVFQDRNIAAQTTTDNISVTQEGLHPITYSIDVIVFSVSRLGDTYEITQKAYLEPRADDKYNLSRIESQPLSITRIAPIRRSIEYISAASHGDYEAIMLKDTITGGTFNLKISNSLLANLGNRYQADSQPILKHLARVINDELQGEARGDYLLDTNTGVSSILELVSFIRQGKLWIS